MWTQSGMYIWIPSNFAFGNSKQKVPTQAQILGLDATASYLGSTPNIICKTSRSVHSVDRILPELRCISIRMSYSLNS